MRIRRCRGIGAAEDIGEVLHIVHRRSIVYRHHTHSSLNKLVMPKGTDSFDPRDSAGIYWLECSSCQGWDIFENSGIPGPYNARTALKAKFTCRYCMISKRLDSLVFEFNKFSTKFNVADVDQWSDVVRNLPNEIKANKDQISKLADSTKLINDQIISVKDSIAKSSVSANTDILSAQQLRQASTECLEVENRKLSLVVAGLPDRGNDVADFIA